jgi:(S)-2-hydroxyglutarate dehydrogenase
MRRTQVVIIGGGIVGLATGYKLLELMPDAGLTILEKESGLARHQTSHNSGVLHAGLYYRPGTAKARLAVAGIREMTGFCAAHRVAHEICGKLVVATNDAELAQLRDLHERGNSNGLRGLELIGPEHLREIEPHAGGIAALRVPEEGIVDYPAVCAALAGLIGAAGGRVVLRAGVHALRRQDRGWVVETTAGEFAADFVVGCAGLHADRIARLGGMESEVRIVPFRGEYFMLRPERQHLVHHLIYPVPDPAFPFLGVHFTRLIHGGVEAGPNAVLALAREGYRRGQIHLADAAETLLFPGVRRFVARHPRATWSELVRSWSRKRFTQSLQRLVPDVQPGDLVPAGAGVRAQAVRPDGTLVEDFSFVESGDSLHVLNAPSPAATASLAIGSEIAARVVARLGVRPSYSH